ncbi:hypothetical protein L1049_020854 [Liquidambar formosana]|uniref:Disease resistance protein n=1 Tax=Liquidambar formosana TaxID=63359 RepID=A0AAP0SAL0_LIQFO
MATLEKLPNLSILCLYDQAFIGRKMVCTPKGFPQLKSLILSNLYNLEEWCVGKEAMPSLCKLVIIKCFNLEMVPDGLRFITTLQELQIVDMPKSFEERIQVVNEEAGEDVFKVQHVPSIIIKTF